MLEHEWIRTHGVVVCHWCGVNKKHKHKECKSNVKLITKGDRLRVVYRKSDDNNRRQ